MVSINLPNIYEKITLWNPVLVRELRSRMRGSRAFTIAGIYVVVLSFVVLLVLALGSSSSSSWLSILGPYQPYQGYNYRYNPRGYSYTQPIITSWILGKALFLWLALLQTLIICILTPAVTATTITHEKQQGTFPLLLLTPMEPMRILTGKLQAATGYLILMVFCSLPMAGIVFFLGGVSLSDMIGVFLIQLICIMTFGMIGMTSSVICKKSATANILAFSIVGFFSAGVVMLGFFSRVLRYSQVSMWGLVLAFVITYIFMAPVAYGVYNLFVWITGKIRKSPPVNYTEIPKYIISPGVRKFAGFGLIANLFCYFAYQPPWIDIAILTVSDISELFIWFNPFVAVYSFIERPHLGSQTYVSGTFNYGYQTLTWKNYIIANPWVVIISSYLIILFCLYFLNRRIIPRFTIER
jgi:hypothetical protein